MVARSNDEYKEWIEANVHGTGIGLCAEYAELMAQAFPGLKAVYGDYVIGGSELQHCWCVDPEGEVVDPTATQFAPGGEYRPIREMEEILPRLREIAREAASLIVAKQYRETTIEAMVALQIMRNFENFIKFHGEVDGNCSGA